MRPYSGTCRLQEKKQVFMNFMELFKGNSCRKSNLGILGAILFAICSLCVLYSCSEDDGDDGETPLPTVSLVDIGRKSAVIEGYIPENLRLEMNECGIYWSEDNPQPTEADNKEVAYIDSLGKFRLELDNLKGGTTYYVKSFVSMSDEVLESNVRTFSTLPGEPELDVFISITDEFQVTITDLGGGEIQEVGYCYVPDNGNVASTFVPDVTNSIRVIGDPFFLSPTKFNMHYSIPEGHTWCIGRVYVITEHGIGYSEVLHYRSHIR